nr:embryogenesis-associated protein EMB8-like [Tanacetum cinerariifolium]
MSVHPSLDVSGGAKDSFLPGGSGESYIKHMLSRARNKGWRVVVFNSRGCGDSPVITPQ